MCCSWRHWVSNLMIPAFALAKRRSLGGAPAGGSLGARCHFLDAKKHNRITITIS